MLAAAGVAPPYVVVGHSYGGMVAREFARLYPEAVAGMVLLDASSEPDIPVYERLHAGPWIDGTVEPGPNQRLDMHATVRELRRSPSLGDMPLIVVTAGVLQDQWLSTVPVLASRAQTRLAGLSSNSIHVLDRGEGHFIPDNDPGTVIRAALAVVDAARARGLACVLRLRVPIRRRARVPAARVRSPSYASGPEAPAGRTSICSSRTRTS